MSHARGKAEAAEGVAHKATEECRLARVAAKELSPSFHIYGNGEWATGGASLGPAPGPSLSRLNMRSLIISSSEQIVFYYMWIII